MNTLLEMRTAIQTDFTIGDESTLYSPTVIDSAINRAYQKCATLFNWPELQDAKKTSTQANQEYYDYPQTWRSNSIWKIEIDGVRYGEDPDGSPLSFDDYLNWKEDYPDATDKKWANQWRRYFIHPTPTVAGSNNISVWGMMNVESLTEDADTTIFSYGSPECNEAIVLEAIAILKSKTENDKSSQFKSQEAKQILLVTWGRISKEMAKYEKNQPFFDVPDYYSNNSSVDMTGKFNTRV